MANTEPVSIRQVELPTTETSDIDFALVGSILGPLEVWGAGSWVWSSPQAGDAYVDAAR